jgi:replicative DNA helicase
MSDRHDDDAERVVLGSLMVTPKWVDDTLATGITPEDFYQPAHELVFAAILAANRAGEPHTAVDVAQRLGGDIRRVGGASYLHDLISSVPTAVNGPFQAGKVVALARLRRAQELGAKLVEDAANANADDADEVIEGMRALFDERTQSRQARELDSFETLMTEAMERWETPDADVLPTGLLDLDEKFNGGLRPGHLAIFAARPAVGKSVAATVIAAHVARAGRSVLMASLEMSKAEVTDRIAANVAGVDLERITRRTLTEIDWKRAAKALGDIAGWRLAVDDRPGLTVNQIRSKARDLARRPGGLDLLVVDYLQIVAPADRRDQRHLQVGRIAEDLRAVSKELGVPVLALAQINRAAMARADSRPTMADIRESGAIEAHADEIVLLHRDDENAPGEIEFNVEKNRHGRTGRVAFAWAPHHSRIASIARWQDEPRTA